MRLTIAAKPGSARPGLSCRNDVVTVAVRERAIDGRANDAIVAAIAGWLDVPARQVTLALGGSGRTKAIDIDGVKPDELAAKIAALPAR